jgi:hypothetical protein
MRTQLHQKTFRVGDTVFNASRQVWLAGLGAAAMTRGWAEKEAGGVFRTLIREGTFVESRAIRFVGDQVETSISTANALWKNARASVEATVRTYADSAVALVRQSLPRALPAVELPAMLKKPARAKRARGRKAAVKRTAATAKRTGRAKRAAPKR